MSFRDEFFSARRLPERIRHRTPAAISNPVRGIWSDRARSCEFPRFARELALNA